ncbi:MAG: UDP-N-acetylmuramoyl-tripeptide--D-alanyl-D-alanine ligase [Mariprofundales bacterium]|nr:UDP-N-acetylmuramoyl-tripeptide--D-alanyl-D-alanine ligase [Mariprofundales bacterium]
MSGAMMAQATGGRWYGTPPSLVTGCSIDSRHATAEQAFVALRGPNHDGHAFAAKLDGRIAALIGERRSAGLWQGMMTPQLLVEDSYQALIDLAACWRQQLPVRCRVIAVVGSQGKTTLRRMIAHLLQHLGVQVAQTQGNLNNLIGTPLTLLKVPTASDVAVVECGISEPGEMARLAKMVRPDLVVIPALSLAHSAGLHDLATIVREKGVMAQAATEACVVGSGVAEMLARFEVMVPAPMVTADQQVAWQLTGSQLILTDDATSATLNLPWPAAHMAANMALAATVVRRIVPDSALDVLAHGLQSWQPMAGRMGMVSGRGGCRILDDSYNANPASMEAALTTLRAMDGRTVAILGDMGELGAHARQAHESLGVAGVDCLLLVGSAMRYLADHQPQAQWFATTEALLSALDGLGLSTGDVVLVKGSHMMALEQVVARLMVTREAEADPYAV